MSFNGVKGIGDVIPVRNDDEFSDKEFIIELPDRVPLPDIWYLWQIEDRVAGRASPLYCSSSKHIVRRSFLETVQKLNAKPGDLRAYIRGVFDQGRLMVLDEYMGES